LLAWHLADGNGFNEGIAITVTQMVISKSSWPAAMALSPDVVHVWCVPLDLPEGTTEPLLVNLSEEEMQRAGRFHFPIDRSRFIVRRACLREILARYLGTGAGEIHFCYGEHGKPALALQDDAGTIGFNVSKSQGIALIAVGLDRDLGVDVEFVRPVEDAMGLASRFFTERENAELKRLPNREQLDAFFTCWTRKEAILKAVGTGLAAPLQRLDVSTRPDEPVRWLPGQGGSLFNRRWALESYRPAEGYVATLASREPRPHLKQWQWMG